MNKSHVLTFQLFTCFIAACTQDSPGAGGPYSVPSAGDRVLMSATTQDPLRPARVLQTTRKVTNELVSIKTAEGTVVTTPDHLFARFEHGWTPAGRLSVGDKIVSEATPQGSPILEITSKDVASTNVYNLTIAKTHTYLVGSAGLLVHNVDCWNRPRRPPSDRGDRSDDDGSRSDDDGYRSDDDGYRSDDSYESEPRNSLDDLLAREREHDRQEKRRFNDSEGRRANENCVFCTIGGLSDYDKLSVFLRDSGLSDKNSVSPAKNYELLERFKLRTKDTPPSAKFEPTRKKLRWPSRQNPQRDAEKFMQKSSSNTFALIIKGTPQSPFAHSMIAVRQPNGRITYIDLQKNPPATYDALHPSIQSVDVIPTDVDWRFNRELSKVIQDSPPSDRQTGWPK